MKFKYQKILWDIETFLEKNTQTLQKKEKFLPQNVDRDGFWFTENIGNNSFCFQENKKIWVAPIIYGDETNIQSGSNIVFEDENIQSTGLNNFILGKTQNSQTSIFICDNHNYVLEVWEQYKKEKFILIHIDQHRDDAIWLNQDLDYLKSTKICDYIDFAIKNGWISQKYFSFTESKDLEQIQEAQKYKNILNIDLDFFVPELTTISLEEKLEIILSVLTQTEIITLATSPLFIDQQFAQGVAKLFWKYL